MRIEKQITLLCPSDKTSLVTTEDSLKCPNCGNVFKIKNKVIKFLEDDNLFYEGRYKNKIKYLPKRESFIWLLPIWMLSNNYVWNVRKQMPEGSTIIELGCAGGVEYFGKRYNMIGMDLSYSSLADLTDSYNLCIQADAMGTIPLPDSSVDAVISSYFWEHITKENKLKMLKELYRVLKPGGKIIFLYDVETKNKLLKKLKVKNSSLYEKLFLEGDSHVGYHTPEENEKIFAKSKFSVTKNFGMERTWLQSHSVYLKLIETEGLLKFIGKVGLIFLKPPFYYMHLLMVLLIDHTIGRLWPIENSRILLTIAKKNT